MGCLRLFNASGRVFDNFISDLALSVFNDVSSHAVLHGLISGKDDTSNLQQRHDAFDTPGSVFGMRRGQSVVAQGFGEDLWLDVFGNAKSLVQRMLLDRYTGTLCRLATECRRDGFGKSCRLCSCQHAYPLYFNR